MTSAPINTDTPEATDSPQSIQLPIDAGTKGSILLNIESAVKELITALAKKDNIKGAEIKADAYSHLPNSITGVVMHYVIKGIKDELDIGFTQTPTSLKVRGNSAYDKKVSGKKRLLTREQKNELLARTQMSYYQIAISNNEITLDDAINSIKEAFEKKMEFEKMGYILPDKKTAYPFWVDEETQQND